MYTYLVYCKNTGNILHAHVDDDGTMSPDEVLDMVYPDCNRDQVAVVPTSTSETPDNYPIFDVNQQALRPVSAEDEVLKTASGGGGGSVLNSPDD